MKWSNNPGIGVLTNAREVLSNIVVALELTKARRSSPKQVSSSMGSNTTQTQQTAHSPSPSSSSQPRPVGILALRDGTSSVWQPRGLRPGPG